MLVLRAAKVRPFRTQAHTGGVALGDKVPSLGWLNREVLLLFKRPEPTQFSLAPSCHAMPRLRRRLQLRVLKIAVILLVSFDFWNVLSTQRAVSRIRSIEDHSDSAKRQKIYVASTHWNNEYILRNYWTDSIVALAKHFGPSNVYISVYESGSWDDSKGALRQLDVLLDSLHVNRTIVLDETSHKDEIAKEPASTGWIDTPRGKKELRRIPYLSRMRNLSLEPLEKLLEEGVRFDKILFLNDVVFTVCSTPCSIDQKSYA